MTKEEYIKLVDKRFKNNVSKEIMKKQIERYYEAKDNYNCPKHNYKLGDEVKLPKGTLLHGTYKNIDGLKHIANDGLVSSEFIEGRGTKYPSCVGVWNLKQDYLLKDYIHFYSGGTIMFRGDDFKKTKVISYDDIPNLMNIISEEKNYHIWVLEQTKEARFMPSLVQDNVQIGVIFNGNNKYVKELLKGDVLHEENINNKDVEEFVNPEYYERFLKDRKDPDDFFTDRESAVLFGIPSNMIEGILVGRKYEKDNAKLNEIKQLVPNAYICNLDGKVIKE